MAIYTTEQIGEIKRGIDGTQEYLLINVENGEDITISDVKSFVAERYFYDSHYPGAQFCTLSTVMAKPYHPNEYLVILYHNFDC